MKTEGRPQISPLRYASVEMTILFEHKIPRFPGDIRGNRGSPGVPRDDKRKSDILMESGCWKEDVFQISFGQV
jgi:hypothetical protein